MEYCPGGDLFDLITKKYKGQALKESHVSEIIYDLLKAINHCHESKIVHWDIKAENVMVGEDG